MIDRAEKLTDDQRFEEAWAIIDLMAPDERTTPRSLRVRLRCCAGLCRWDLGEDLAEILSWGSAADKMCASAFYHCLAVAHLQDGDHQAARIVLAKAIGAWGLSRLAIIEDKRLDDLF